MKTASRLAFVCLGGYLLVGIAFALVLQRQALNHVRQENRLLLQRVEELVAQTGQLTAETERLSKLTEAQHPKDGLLPQEQFAELLRLRGEVGRLHLQDREAEQSRRDRMQGAQAKLPDAELNLHG